MKSEKIKNVYVEVSVIIVSYNNFDVLEDCLQSLIKFTQDVVYEIIIVDNNSMEGNISDFLTRFDKDIILIKNDENRGFAMANNQGMKIARGEYFLLLNSDTVFIQNSIRLILDFYKSFNPNMLVGIKLLNQDYTHQPSVYDFDNIFNVFGESFFIYKLFPKLKIFNKYWQNAQNYELPVEVDVIMGAFIFGSKSVFEKLKGFDERFFFYSEEVDLCLRFKKNYNGKIIYYPKTSIIHLKGGTSNDVPYFQISNLRRSKLKFFKKHFSSIDFLIIYIIYTLGMVFRVPIYLFGGIFLNRKTLLKKSFFYFKSLRIN